MSSSVCINVRFQVTNGGFVQGGKSSQMQCPKNRPNNGKKKKGKTVNGKKKKGMKRQLKVVKKDQARL